jgi:hypothetical protein
MNLLGMFYIPSFTSNRMKQASSSESRSHPFRMIRSDSIKLQNSEYIVPSIVALLPFCPICNKSNTPVAFSSSFSAHRSLAAYENRYLVKYPLILFLFLFLPVRVMMSIQNFFDKRVRCLIVFRKTARRPGPTFAPTRATVIPVTVIPLSPRTLRIVIQVSFMHGTTEMQRSFLSL